jgi:RNA polymerase sigma-70 factor, ECF subfamily
MSPFIEKERLMFWPFHSRAVPQQNDGVSLLVEDLDDSTLIRRSSQRDAAAFGVLYERYMDRVYRYIAYKTSNQAIAEDLTSEVFLNAWKSIDRYEDRGYAFSTWLLRLAHNEVTDYYRKKRNTTPLPETDIVESSAPAPGEFVELQEEQQALLRAINQLPEEWRQVLLLRFVEGVSFEEVAAIVGKSSGACRVIQHRALARLREILPLEEKRCGA